MPNQSPPANRLDAVYQALSHPARRSVVRRLSRGAASVSDLADPFDMALPSFMQHLDVLADCGLVDSEKVGRVRVFRLTPAPLRQAESWLSDARSVWEARLDQLDDYLIHLHNEESTE